MKTPFLLTALAVLPFAACTAETSTAPDPSTPPAAGSQAPAAATVANLELENVP